MPTALAIQHVAFEDLGYFAPLLVTRGYSVRTLEAPLADWSRIDPLAADLWIVLGGPIGVYEIDKYPFLKQELRLLEQRLAAGKPTLGICLGSQLIAQALGARVYSSGLKELGWGPLQLSETGQASCLAPLGAEPVLHWHGDTFDLPVGASLLASTEQIKHQAFAWGDHCLALQFHVEITEPGMERWLVGHTLEISLTPGASVNGLRADTARHAPGLAQRGEAMLDAWLGRLSA
jgi:GMP synthase (glutamine-hydrolysing)